ncbi:MAG: hypothetical protein AB7F78_25665 [Hyphomicrobiaceae bacterium]
MDYRIGDPGADAKPGMLAMIVKSRTGLPRVVQLLAVNGAAGALVGGSAAGGLMLTDAGGIGTLLAQSGTGMIGGSMLVVSFALTFASLAMASAVMLLPRR